MTPKEIEQALAELVDQLTSDLAEYENKMRELGSARIATNEARNKVINLLDKVRKANETPAPKTKSRATKAPRKSKRRVRTIQIKRSQNRV